MVELLLFRGKLWSVKLMLTMLAPTARQRERAANGRGAPKMAPA